MFRRGGLFPNTIVRKAAMILFWILIWHGLTVLVDNSILLVTPWEVLRRLAELVVRGAFWQAAVTSLLRIGAGFLLGVAAALILAQISLCSSWVEEFLQPVMSLMKTVPVASFVVLFLIWWGSSALVTAVSFLVVVPNIYLNTLEGLKAVDVRLLEMARVFRISGEQRFWMIYRPALRPFLTSAMKLSLGMCWKSGAAAEIIGTPAHSIGGEIYLSKIYLDTAGVLAWTVVIIVLSLCFEKLILKLMDGFFDWIPRISEKKRMADCGKFEEGTRLCIDNVCKTYGIQKVLSHVSAVYEKGGTYYLTSPSGSGKTTLLRLLCGLEKPESGIITGTDRVSMMFQEDRLCEEYSAVQNVAVVTGSEKTAAEALEKLLEAETLDKPCSQLSGGMKRRVALVRAMEAKSEVVLLDEPFTGMDADTRREAEKYILQSQRGRILLIATHI